MYLATKNIKHSSHNRKIVIDEVLETTSETVRQTKKSVNKENICNL